MLKVTVLDKKDAANCPFRDVIDRIGDKWTLLVLVVLEDGSARFSEIKRTIGDISQKVLTKTLQQLEADGYLTRTAFDQSPPKVVYELTEMGYSVLIPITALVEWAEANHGEIRKNRSAYQRKKSKQI